MKQRTHGGEEEGKADKIAEDVEPSKSAKQRAVELVNSLPDMGPLDHILDIPKVSIGSQAVKTRSKLRLVNL